MADFLHILHLANTGSLFFTPHQFPLFYKLKQVEARVEMNIFSSIIGMFTNQFTPHLFYKLIQVYADRWICAPINCLYICHIFLKNYNFCTKYLRKQTILSQLQVGRIRLLLMVNKIKRGACWRSFYLQFTYILQNQLEICIQYKMQKKSTVG